MVAATFNKFNCFENDKCRGKHDFTSHTYKIMLSNTPPVATNTVKGDITEIAAGNGYTAGGFAVTMTLSQSGAVTKITAADLTFTVSGGSVGPYKYMIVYNDTTSTKPLAFWFEVATAQTIPDGDLGKFDFVDADGIYTVQ